MKILVACELPEEALAELRSLGSEVVIAPDPQQAPLKQAISGVGILIVDGRRVSPEVLTRGDALQMIVHAGAGASEISIEEASANGIFVTHCPDQHALAVAELTFGLMLALDRRIVEQVVALREGRWNRGAIGTGLGLAGRTLGVLGFDAVTRAIAQRGRAFGMNVIAWRPERAPDMPFDAETRFVNWPRELAREADILAVHVTSAGLDTQPLIDAEFLANVRDGAILINTGSASVVDEAALAEAAQKRDLRVGLDVFSSEPAGDSGRFRSRLCELPGVIGTQHIGARTRQARGAIAREVVRIVRAFLISGEIENCINLIDRSPATWQLVLRAKDAVGVMASVLEVIRADGINAEEIASRVFAGARAAWCTVALDERPSTEALEAIRSLPEVLYLELRAVV